MNSNFTDQLPDWLKGYDPLLVLGVGALLCLVGIVLIILMIRKATRKPLMPALSISSFQVAPMGKDAFLKLTNQAEKLSLLSLEILNQPNIKVKNQVAGHILDTTTSYSILLESMTNEKIGTDFKVAISYLSGDRKTYRQVFSLNPMKTISIRKIR